MNKIECVILAGGKGKRMKSETPKVLLEIANKPILQYALETLSQTNIKKIYIVKPMDDNLVPNTLKSVIPKNLTVEYVNQDRTKALGTAIATKLGIEKMSDDCTDALVAFGDDSALYKPQTINSFCEFHTNNNNLITIMTFEIDSPTFLGGLELDANGNLLSIMTKSQMEQKGLTKNIVMPGLICIKKDWFLQNVDKLRPSSISGEFTLPSIFALAREQDFEVKSFMLKDKNQWNSVNTPLEFDITVEKKLNQLADNQTSVLLA